MFCQLPLFEFDQPKIEGVPDPDPLVWLRQGAHLILSVSGKDSQAMTLHVLERRQQERWTGEISLLYCDLQLAEWKVTLEYLQRFSKKVDVPLSVVSHKKYGLIEGIQAKYERKPDTVCFPDSQNRWCTSDYKRQPTNAFITERYPKDAFVVVAQGLRAAESAQRARKNPVTLRSVDRDGKPHSPCSPTKNRWVMDWYPVFDWSLEQVWQQIGLTMPELVQWQTETEQLKQFYNRERLMAHLLEKFPSHPSYALKSTRLSCACCIMGSANDIRIGAEWNPDAYIALCRIEAISGYSFRKDFWLSDLHPDLLPPDIRSAVAEHKITRNLA